MKKTLFFVAGIAVGLCTSLVGAQGAASIAVLNTPGVYIELVTLVPGQGQANTPAFRAKWASSPRAKWCFRAPLDASLFGQARPIGYRALRRTIFAMKAIDLQRST